MVINLLISKFFKLLLLRQYRLCGQLTKSFLNTSFFILYMFSSSWCMIGCLFKNLPYLVWLNFVLLEAVFISKYFAIVDLLAKVVLLNLWILKFRISKIFLINRSSAMNCKVKGNIFPWFYYRVNTFEFAIALRIFGFKLFSFQVNWFYFFCCSKRLIFYLRFIEEKVSFKGYSPFLFIKGHHLLFLKFGCISWWYLGCRAQGRIVE